MSLQDPVYRKYLMDKGFLWVRPLVRPWRTTLREPTIGRLVEVLTCECRGAVHIQSPAGKRLIHRFCGL